MTKKDRRESANNPPAPREVEELYQGLLTTSQTVIFVVQDGKFVYVNLGFEHRTGYKNEELVGKDALELVHPDDREMVRTEAIRRLKGEEDSPYEYRFIAKDGSTRWGMEKVTSITYQGKKATLVNSMDITERKIAEYELLKERKSLANIMATIPDSLLVLDKSLCIKRANRSFYEMFKTEPQRILGKRISEVLPDEEGKLTGRLAKLLRTEDAVERFEITYRSEQVGEKILSVTARGIIFAEEEEEEEELLVVLRDITQQRKAEEKLWKSERRFRRAFEANPDLTFLLDKDGVFVDVNKAALEMLGFEEEEIIGSSLWDAPFFPYEARQKATESFERRKEGEEIPSYPLELRTKDGKAVYVEVNVGKFEEEGFEGEIAIARDVTEQKKVEEELRAIVEGAPIGFIRLDEGFHITYENPKTKEIMGVPGEKSEALGVDIRELSSVVKTGIPMPIESWLRGEEIEIETHFESIYGKESFLRVRGVPFYKGDEFDGGILTLEDITDRKRAEEKYTFESNLLNSLLENADDLVCFKDREGHYLRASGAYRDMLGLDVEGKTAFELYPEDEARQMHEDDLEVMEKDIKVVGREQEVTLPDGINRWLSTTKVPRYDDEGSVIGMVGISRDITDRKKAEMQLRESSEKLKNTMEELRRSNQELEQFAYVASHDLQEPLRMVSSYMHLLEKRYHDKLDEDGKEFMHYAVDGSKRMQRLISDLLTYSRVGTRGKPFQPTSCDAVLRSVVVMLEMAIRDAGAEVTWDNMPQVTADEGQLVQLFQNLIANAIKFRGGKTSRVHISARERPDDWLFSVQDNGIGIAPEFKERVFLIFQRLHKGEYEGTGTGLAVCKKIVERHGGQIWLESEPGQGTTFYFTLPKEAANEGPKQHKTV